MTSAAARPDPRRHAWREDLAAESLRGQVEVPRYAAGEPHHVIRPAIALRREPQFTASIETEALFGEAVIVYDIAAGWAWGQLERDRYVGYLPADALRRGAAATTHRVSAIGTFIYSAADIKAPPLMHLSLNAQLAVVERQERFSRLAGGGFAVNRHISERDRYARDFVDVAERLIGTPYLWGGRTRLGLDCSGLVQIAMEAAGLRCPRDTDMQQAELGSEVLVPASLEGLQRGDLVFWRGHVGIMVDGLMIVHANAHHMAVAVEPLAVAVERIRKSEGGMASVRRLPKLSGDGA